MSDEIKFKKKYRDTYKEIKTPEELSQRVLQLSILKDKKKKDLYVKKLVAAVAMLFLLFSVGNGIVYAATGRGLIESARLYIDGKFHALLIEEKTDENGNCYYEIAFGEEDIKSEESSFLTDFPYQFIVYYEVEGVEIIESDKRFYLVDEDIKIDITNDLVEGSATGTYEKNGCIHDYKVTKVLENIWDIRISNKSSVKKITKIIPITK